MQRIGYPGKTFFSFKKKSMHIQHKENNNRGAFFIEDDGEIVAEIVYGKSGGNVLIIEHTEVDKELQGQNIGFELVHKTVDYARTHGLKIAPVCPFAKAVFDKRADFKDVLNLTP